MLLWVPQRSPQGKIAVCFRVIDKTNTRQSNQDNTSTTICTRFGQTPRRVSRALRSHVMRAQPLRPVLLSSNNASKATIYLTKSFTSVQLATRRPELSWQLPAWLVGGTLLMGSAPDRDQDDTTATSLFSMKSNNSKTLTSLQWHHAVE
jgi:hypothetical protein